VLSFFGQGRASATGAALALALAFGSVLQAVPAGAGDITFWTWRQEDRAQYAQLFKEFNQTHPDVRITFQGYEPQNYQTVLSTALAAGTGPDVIHVRAYGGLEQFARSGYLMPLDPAKVPELANFSEEALASASFRADGKVYSVPFASQTLGLFINQEVFQRAGLQPPETWADVKAACGKLKEQGLIPLANGTATAWMTEVFTSVFTNSFLGRDFAPEVVAGKATFEDPRYISALEKLLELRDCLPPGFSGIDYPTSQQLFLSGRAAMFAGGSFEIANFRKQNPRLAMDFIAPPAPQAGAPRLVSLFYDGGYAVNARSANTDDGLKLVRYMGTPAFGNRFTELLGNLSPIGGVEVKDPLLAKVADLNKSAAPYIMAVHFRYQEPTGSTLLQGAVQRMMAGNAAPAEVGREITRGIATYYEPFQKR